MAHQIATFLSALTFFTRIRLPDSLGRMISHDTRLTDAVVWFPVVGLMIAIVPAGLWFVMAQVMPPELAAGLAVASALLLTGALHEDGFADCADGLGATADREKALEIMRDSRIGTYGAIALIISVGLRWMALASLSPIAGVAALLIAHSASRSTITIAMKWSTYARTKGLGKMASGEVPDIDFAIAILLAFVAGLSFGQMAGIVAVLCGFIAGWLLLRYLRYRIGGYTGDGLGAIQQVSEISIMIILAGFWT